MLPSDILLRHQRDVVGGRFITQIVAQESTDVIADPLIICLLSKVSALIIFVITVYFQ